MTARSVPANSYETPVGRFNFPKDMIARDVIIAGTNFTLRIGYIESRNSPDVIDSASAGQAMILEKTINATGGAVGNAMAAYHKGMMIGGGAPPKPAPQPQPSPVQLAPAQPQGPPVP
jgi:hypothetical protein